MIPPEHVAWAAGIFEGEGWVGNTYPHRGTRPYVTAAVAMTDEDIIARLHALLGGTMSGPHKGVNKPRYQWTVSGWEGVARLYDIFEPWLGTRRSAQFTAALALRPLTTYDPAAVGRAKTHCPQGHEYTPANTYITKSSTRDCRVCRRDKARKRRLVAV